MTCPMCRSHFDKLFVPEVDKDLQDMIALKMGAQFEERKAELEAAGEWVGLRRLIKFAYGNTHEDTNKTMKLSSGETTSVHRWCMFVSLNGNPEET